MYDPVGTEVTTKEAAKKLMRIILNSIDFDYEIGSFGGTEEEIVDMGKHFDKLVSRICKLL